MKRIFSGLTLLVMILSSLQVAPVMAYEQTVLDQAKQKSIQALDHVEHVVDKTVASLETKVGEEKLERLEEKQEEVQEYIQEVQKKIAQENSTADIKEKMKEAGKVVALKVVSGVTEYTDVGEGLSDEVAQTQEEKEEALEVVQESLETKSGDYSIIVSSRHPISKITSSFRKFDPSIRMNYLYGVDGESYYEVFIEAESIFRTEMLEDIESGILPESFLGIEIVMPEVFGVSSLQGENISQTWGIEQWPTYAYAHQNSESSKTIRVGVVDTGINYSHPDLSQNVIKGYDFVNEDGDAMDDQGHGTHVAGTIAANINGSGIIGVNPYVTLVPLKICDERGYCPSYAVIRALEYARENGLDLLNMSLGGRGDPSDHAICSGISGFVRGGGLVVAASGNSNIDTSKFVPGGCADAITVAAIDRSGKRAVFSNYGSKVDVAAPGVGIYSTSLYDTYRELSGTSMAAPHVTGLVSIIKAIKGDLNTSSVRSLLGSYPKGISTDVHKPIAAGVDVVSLLTSLSESDKLEVTSDEEVIEVVEHTEATDDAQIIQGLTFDLAEYDDEIKEEMLEILPTILNVDIPLFGQGESIEINDVSDLTEQVEQLDLAKEPKKNSRADLPRAPVFDHEGTLLGDDIQINENIELDWEAPEAGVPTTISAGEIEGDMIGLGGEGKIYAQDELDGFATYEEDESIQINSTLNPDSFQELTFAEDESAEHDVTGDEVVVYQEIGDPLEHTSEVTLGETPGVVINSVQEEQMTFEKVLDEDVAIDFAAIETIPTYVSDPEIRLEGALDGVVINDVSDFDDVDLGITQEVDPDSISLVTPDTVEVREQEEVLVDEQQDAVQLETPADLQAELDLETEDDLDAGQSVDVSFEGYDPASDEGLGIQNTYSCEIFAGQTCVFSIYKPYRYEHRVENPENISSTSYRRELVIRGEEAGDSVIHLYRRGRKYFTIMVTVKAVPAPKEYQASVELGKEVRVDFGSNASRRYEFGENIGRSYHRDDHVILYGQQYGETDIKVTAGGLHTATIRFAVVPPTISYEIYTDKELRASLRDAERYDYAVSQEGVLDVDTSRNDITFIAKNAGSTRVEANRSGVTEAIFEITVSDPPEPVREGVTLLQGDHLTLQVNPDDYYWFQKKNVEGAVIAGSYSRRSGTYRIHARESGTMELHITNNRKGFVERIVDIVIVERVPEVFDVQTTVGARTLMNNADYGPVSKFTTTDSTISRVSKTGSTIRVHGLREGSAEIYVKSGNIHYYTLKVEVGPAPEPEVRDVILRSGEDTEVFFEGGLKHWKLETHDTNSRLSAYNGGNMVRLNAKLLKGEEGRIDMNVIDDDYVHRYTLRLRILPPPPVEIIANAKESRMVLIPVRGISYTDITSSDPSDVTVDIHGDHLRITPNKAGRIELYLKNQGLHSHTIILHVEAKPEVKEYEFMTYTGGTVRVTLPESIDQYGVKKEGGDNIRDVRFSGTDLLIWTTNPGKTTYRFQDDEGFDRYVVHVESVPRIETWDIHLTDHVHKSYGSSARYRLVSGEGVRVWRNSQDGLNVGAEGLGQSIIYIYSNSGYLKTILTVNVTEIPEPVKIECAIEVGNHCTIKVPKTKYFYQSSKDDMIRFAQGSNMLRIEGLSSGEATVMITSQTGQYYSHQVQVKVHAKDVNRHTCVIPVGGQCRAYSSYRASEGYTYTTSDPDVVTARSVRSYSESRARGYDRLEIEGELSGETDVYVYKNGDHIATIQIEVLLPSQPIAFSSDPIIVKEGGSTSVTVSGGSGDYVLDGYKSDVIEARLSKGGKLEIEGKQWSNTGLYVKDKYGKTGGVRVIVDNATLVIEGPSKVILQPDEHYKFGLADSYGNITKIEKSSNHATIDRSTGPDGKPRFTISAHYTGRTLFVLTDEEGNRDGISVTIAGDRPNPDTELYRYRDDICPEGDTSGDLRDGRCLPVDASEDTPASDDPVKDDKLEEILRQILEELGVDSEQLEKFKISSDEGVEISSVKYAYRCEEARSGKYWVRPVDGECVDNVNRSAWDCKSGYKDIFSFGVSSCVRDELVTPELQITVRQLQESIDIFERAVRNANLSKVSFERMASAILDLQLDIKRRDYSLQKEMKISIVLDELRHRLDRQVDDQYKEYSDIQTWYDDIVIMSDNGSFGGDFVRADLTGLSLAQKERMIETFATKLIDYQLSYDPVFRAGYEKQVNEEASRTGDNRDEIARGLKDGSIDGTKDYLMGYIELAKSLSKLKFSMVLGATLRIWESVKSPIETAKQIGSGLITFVSGLYEKVAMMTGYERSKGGSYVGTNVALGANDPSGKLLMVAGGKLVGKMSKYVDDILELEAGKNKDAGRGAKAAKHSKNLEKLLPLMKNGQRTLDHILKGEIKNGKAEGFHSKKAAGSNAKVTNETSARDEYGSYYAEVEVRDPASGNMIPKEHRSSGLLGASSMFPDAWGEEEIVEAILEAINGTKVHKGGAKYSGFASNGMEITLILSDGKIVTAWPVIDNGLVGK